MKTSTSFTCSPIVRRQLRTLTLQYGENASQVIVRLITEAHARVIRDDYSRKVLLSKDVDAEPV